MSGTITASRRRTAVITLAVNGYEVSGVSKCNPRKGYLALESEGSECHFKNLKIKELPSSNPKPDEVADVAQGHKQLYTGLDLSGWKVDDEAKKHWQPRDTVLHYDGKGQELRTEKEYGGAEVVVDFRFPNKDAKPCTIILRDGHDDGFKLSFTAGGNVSASIQGHASAEEKAPLKPAGQWNRLRGSLEENGAFDLTLNGEFLMKGRPPAVAKKGAFVLRPEGEMDFANLFVRELK